MCLVHNTYVKEENIHICFYMRIIHLEREMREIPVVPLGGK